MASAPPGSVAALLALARLDRLERRILLSAASGMSREDMARAPETILDAATKARYEALLSRREDGEPIAYLTGEREFFGRPFSVDRRVLIPRPESELLIELALTATRNIAHPAILDLGTGSGCLAITLSLEHPGAEVIALDVSSEALEVAADNNQRLAAGVHFMQGDLLKTSEILARLGDQPGRFDAIVANPPYIAEHDPHLTQGDLRYEPKSALTDGHDGLRLIDACIRLAKLALLPRGLILIEHGYDQASEVRGRLLQAGFTAPRSWADLAGIERVSGATR